MSPPVFIIKTQRRGESKCEWLDIPENCVVKILNDQAEDRKKVLCGMLMTAADVSAIAKVRVHRLDFI